MNLSSTAFGIYFFDRQTTTASQFKNSRLLLAFALVF
jgi:hypothetical protein